jgi:molecular chaperone DnaJ
MAKDFYKILGITKDASQEGVKKAYRKLARKWHPDINPGNKVAEERFKDISSAYDCLGNEERRKLYDEFGEEGLHAGFDAEKARQYRQWGAYQQQDASDRAWTGQEFGRYQSYEDIFGDILGGGRERGGRDLEHDLTIDLISALKGFDTELSMQKTEGCKACNASGIDPNSPISVCTTCGGSGRLNVAEGPIQFTKACPACHGHGRKGKSCSRCGGTGQVQGLERIRVKIPQGVEEGSRIRLAGKGEAGYNGGKPGDLYLIIHVRPHNLLKREGDDLFMEIPITVSEAIIGGTISIPTIDGKVNVKVPPKSQSGQILRLKGKGAVNIKTKKKGDLMLKLIVKVPQTDEREILKAAEKMNGFYKEDPRGNIRL